MFFFTFVTMLLTDSTQYTQAQVPELKVVPAVIRQSDLVNLSCELPGTSVSKCYFCINTSNCTWKYSESCRLALSGNTLTRSGQSGIASVEMKCHYNVGTQSPSPFSHPTSVTIVGSPQLLVSHQVIRATDRVHLTCQTPQSALVPQCFFSVQGNQIKRSKSSCQLKRNATDLLPWSGLRSSTQISLSCYYTVKTEESSKSLSSEPSKPVLVTLIEELTPHLLTHPTRPTSGIGEKSTTTHPLSNVAKTTSNTLVVKTKTSTTPHLTSNPAKTSSVTSSGPEGIWIKAVTSFGVSMFVVVLFTSIFCLRKRKSAVKRKQTDTSPARHENFQSDTDISPGVIGDEEMQLSSTVVSSELMVTQDADQNTANMDCVYSSIPDDPNVSNQAAMELCYGIRDQSLESTKDTSDIQMALEEEEFDAVYSSIPDISSMANQDDCLYDVDHVYNHLEPTYADDSYHDVNLPYE